MIVPRGGVGRNKIETSYPLEKEWGWEEHRNMIAAGVGFGSGKYNRSMIATRRVVGGGKKIET